LNPDDLSPVDAVEKIKVPLLIVHGMLDKKINPQYAQNLYAATKQSYDSILIIPEASHLDLWEKGGEKYFREVELFVNSSTEKFYNNDK